MSHCFRACLTAILFVSAVNAETPPEMTPKLEGRWQLVALAQDQDVASETFLKGAYVDVTDELMVFHVPSKPKYPDLHIKYKFVPEGIDIQFSDSDELDYSGPPIYGKWSMKDGSFKFACFDEEGKPRPPIAPAKSVIYIELKRQPSKK